MNRPEVSEDRWLEISVTAPSECAEPITHLFFRYGDGRVFVSQTGDWDADDPASGLDQSDEVTVYGYLKFDHSIDQRKQMIGIGLRLMSELASFGPQRERVVNAEEWENQSFPTIRVGDRIVISPWSIDDGKPETSELADVNVFLSPGLAFGTGNHPTTRMCLKQIVEEAEAGRLSGSRVVDVGCGSGVLSIVALKLGAADAWCLDIDETAVSAVRDNTEMSGVAEHVNILEGSIPHHQLPAIGFDYVFANITSRVVIDLATELVKCARPGGIILLSGILVDQVDAVKSTFLNLESVEISDVHQDTDWMMLRLIKTAAV